MANVKNLDSKMLANANVNGVGPEADADNNKNSYVSAHVGVTAGVSFRLNSPRKQ